MWIPSSNSPSASLTLTPFPLLLAVALHVSYQVSLVSKHAPTRSWCSRIPRSRTRPLPEFSCISSHKSFWPLKPTSNSVFSSLLTPHHRCCPQKKGVGVLAQGLKDLLYLRLVNFLPGTHLHVLHPEEAVAPEEADQLPLDPREHILQPKVVEIGQLPHSLLTSLQGKPSRGPSTSGSRWVCPGRRKPWSWVPLIAGWMRSWLVCGPYSLVGFPILLWILCALLNHSLFPTFSHKQHIHVLFAASWNTGVHLLDVNIPILFYYLNICDRYHKGELLFSSVEQVNLIHVHWLCLSSLNAPYLGSIEVWGYIWICMRQISPKVPISTCFLPKQLESMDLGASQQCVICGFKVFKKNNFELLNHLNCS